MSIRNFDGRTPTLGNDVYIDPAAVVIGDVTLADEVSVWPTSVIRGDIHSIRIGARTNIQDGSILHVTHDSEFSPGGQPLLVGSEVTVGHRVILHACEIGDRCLIGMGATIMDGARLGDEVMLGAGSLVTAGKVLEGGYLWIGSPARKVRALTEQELGYLRYSAGHYVRLSRRHQTSQTTD